MSTTNGGPAREDQQPQLNVVAQYIKDFSFENPNAPQSLAASRQPPQIDIQINVNAKPLSDTDIEVDAQARRQGGDATARLMFGFELDFAGVFRIRERAAGKPERRSC